MNCSEDYLVAQLKQMHEYHWKRAKELEAEKEKGRPYSSYEMGRENGSLDTVDAILLAVIGGREMYKILEKGWGGTY